MNAIIELALWGGGGIAVGVVMILILHWASQQ